MAQKRKTRHSTSGLSSLSEYTSFVRNETHYNLSDFVLILRKSHLILGKISELYIDVAKPMFKFTEFVTISQFVSPRNKQSNKSSHLSKFNLVNMKNTFTSEFKMIVKKISVLDKDSFLKQADDTLFQSDDDNDEEFGDLFFCEDEEELERTNFINGKVFNVDTMKEVSSDCDEEPTESPSPPKRAKRTRQKSPPSTTTKKPQKSKRGRPPKKLVPTQLPQIALPFTKSTSTELPSNNTQVSKNLHVSSRPSKILCRDTEFSEIYAKLETSILETSGGVIFISGVPGTGKTLVVKNVIEELRMRVQDDDDDLPDFQDVYVNGMSVTDPTQIYSRVWKEVSGNTVKSSNSAMEFLGEYFTTGNQDHLCVLVIDELDILTSKKHSILYNFFEWANYKSSKLFIIAIANTMDLPERYFSGKIVSRIGQSRINFKPYTHQQLLKIITNRLEGSEIFEDSAVELCARKVGAVSGDARRALDICRRAIEVMELQLQNDKSHTDDQEKHNKITTYTINAVVREFLETSVLKGLQHTSKIQKILLCAVLRCSHSIKLQSTNKRKEMTNRQEVELRFIQNELDLLCGVNSLPTLTNVMFESAVMDLSESKFLLVESGSGAGGYRKCKLNVNESDLVIAFKDDDVCRKLINVRV